MTRKPLPPPYVRQISITHMGYEDADFHGTMRFAKAMISKLAKKRSEGKRGWNKTPATGWGCNVRDLERALRGHLAKGDVVDVANFCMMIWNRRHSRGL